MAQETFNFIIQARQAFITLVDSLSVEELNQIPEGFNNNIIWNFGHIVVTTPALCYVRTGIWSDVATIKYWDEFKKDSKPSRNISEDEIEELKLLVISSIESIKEDYKQGTFNHVKPFATATYGADMNNFEEVLVTTAGHDNMHLGYALAQRKLIRK